MCAAPGKALEEEKLYQGIHREREHTMRMVGDGVCGVPPKARFEEPNSPESLGFIEVKDHCEYWFRLWA